MSIQEEKAKLKKMSFTEKIAYIWEYYKFHIGGIILLIFLIVFITDTVQNAKVKDKLYISFTDAFIEEEKIDLFKAELDKILEINPSTEKITIDTSLHFNLNGRDQLTMASEQKLAAMIAASQLDIMITSRETFDHYASVHFFIDLREVLPEEVYVSLGDKIETAIVNQTNEEGVFGITLKDTAKIQNLGSTIKDPVLAIPGSGKNMENALKFIKYILE